MSEKDNNNIDRREFLKTAGAAAIASSAVLSACTGNSNDPQQTYKTTIPEPPTDKMTYRVNPKTNDKVSLLGFGMMRLPVKGGGSGRENKDAELDQEMINKQVDYAIEHGVNMFDTSPAYCQGRSEKATGIALHRYPRDKYFISTKLSNFNPATWSLESGKEMFNNSLKELQVDYVDFLLLHAIGGTSERPNAQGVNEKLDSQQTLYARYIDNGLLDWLVGQQKAGKIKNLGFSYHGDIKMFDLLLKWQDEGKYHWDFVLIELNYLDWKHAREINPGNTNAEYLYAELEKRGIPALIMEPLLGGRLAKVPDFIFKKMKSRDPEHSIASWAMRYAGSPKGVLSVLSGMTYLENVKDNINTYAPLNPVSEEEKNFLEEVADDIVGLNTIPCNDCKYCMPCPYGIDIPAIFVHYNKCINEGNRPNNSQHPEYEKQRKAFLVGYDRSVPRLRQASHCVGCHQCEWHCPQKIKIAEEIQKVDKYVEDLKQGRL